MQSTLKTDAKYLSVNEVNERKTGSLKPIERTENLSKMVHNLVECLNSVAKDEVDEIMANYSNISLLKDDYFKDINNEIKNREIKKRSSMNQSTDTTCQKSLVTNRNWATIHFKVNF